MYFFFQICDCCLLCGLYHKERFCTFKIKILSRSFKIKITNNSYLQSLMYFWEPCGHRTIDFKINY